MCSQFPIEGLPVYFTTIMAAHVFLLFLILLALLLSFPWVATNSQCMLEYVVCVKKRMEKWRKKGFTGQKKLLQSAGWCRSGYN